MTASAAPQKILVIDDEPDITSLLAFNLQANGYVVETLNDPTRSLDRARSFAPDLIVLDVMMPGLSGIQICRLLRADRQLHRVPVFFLTAKVEEADRVQGFESGGDDYICKPFSVKELILRIRSALRRVAEPAVASPRQLRLGGIALDVDRHEVTINGHAVELTATEFKLLHLLMERRGRVQTREHLLLNVWNYDNEIETRTVDTHVRRLREKLGAEADWIETIRGVGYRMSDKRVS
ncbi:MAG: response regulator transcription factor [Opitutae bacterium]|nr:response regulator transcription factor [Opitutae bacterium]